MAVKIELNRGQVKAKINNAWKQSLFPLSSQILQDCNYFVKVDTHMLEASALTHSLLEQGELIWQTPYARRQYWEIKTAFPDVNPNASWKWCERARERFSKDWELLAQKLFDRGGKK